MSQKLHNYFVNAPKVTEHLQHFADTHKNCYFVTAAGLTSNPDILHFNAASQCIFGLRYFAAYHERQTVTEPLADEQTFFARQGNYAELSTDEKVALLKKQLEEGRLSKQEYDLRVDALVSAM